MSILIRGMEIPKHCGYCRFRYDGICHALQKTQYSMEDCPLVPVPPHGRLIDADALRAEVKKHATPSDAWMFSIIRTAPTIIPAEEDEK